MTEDRRETIVACYATDCRYNQPNGIEPTCNLKIIGIGLGGKCKTFEYTPNTKPQCIAPLTIKPGGMEPGTTSIVRVP